MNSEEKTSAMHDKDDCMVHDKLQAMGEREKELTLSVTVIQDSNDLATKEFTGDEDISNCEAAQEELDGLDGVPTDRGWAWVICAGCFLVTFIMSMYDHVLAVMFVDIKERFDVSYPTAAIVFTIYSVTFSVGSVVSSNAIAPRFGDRVVIVVAATCNSLITIVIALSNNVAFFHTLHLIKGFSMGSMWIPAIGLIGQYFKRRRSLATVLANAGVGVSLLAVPPLVRKLLDNFGLQGALLLVSAIEMHGIAAGMLLRPSSSYRHRGYQKQDDKETLSIHEGNLVYDALPRDNNKDEGDIDDDLLKQRKDFNSPCQTYDDVGTGCHAKKKASVIGRPLSSEHQLNKNGNLISQTRDMVEASNNCNGVDSGEVCTLYSVRHRDVEAVDSNEHHQLLQSNCNGYHEGCNARRIHQDNTDTPEKATLVKIETVEAPCDKDYKHDQPGSASCCRRGFEILTAYFDTKLLSDWLMRLVLASTSLGALLQYIPAYIPTLAVERGVDKPLAAILLAICGGVNLASLLLQGVIVDCKILTAANFIGVAQCIVGTMCHLTHFFTSFPTLVLLSVTYGMFGGARMSLIPVVAMDFVGVANLSKALGFNAMVATISLSLHHPFLGYLLESTGSFEVPFHYVGMALYVSAGLLLLEPMGRRLNSSAADRDGK